MSTGGVDSRYPNEPPPALLSVEEGFKGLADNVHQISLRQDNPCGWQVRDGERYLVFASLRKGATDYYTIECGGPRGIADFPKIERDLAMLRAYSGTSMPRVVGNVSLVPFGRWLHGPAMKDAHVTIADGSFRLTATTDANGEFQFKDVPAGRYKAWADHPPYFMTPPSSFDVPETGCGLYRCTANDEQHD